MLENPDDYISEEVLDEDDEKLITRRTVLGILASLPFLDWNCAHATKPTAHPPKSETRKSSTVCAVKNKAVSPDLPNLKLAKYFEKIDTVLKGARFEIPSIKFEEVKDPEIIKETLRNGLSKSEQVFFELLSKKLDDQLREKIVATFGAKKTFKYIDFIRQCNALLLEINVETMIEMEEKADVAEIKRLDPLYRYLKELNEVLIPEGYYLINNPKKREVRIVPVETCGLATINYKKLEIKYPILFINIANWFGFSNGGQFFPGLEGVILIKSGGITEKRKQKEVEKMKFTKHSCSAVSFSEKPNPTKGEVFGFLINHECIHALEHQLWGKWRRFERLPSFHFPKKPRPEPTLIINDVLEEDELALWSTSVENLKKSHISYSMFSELAAFGFELLKAAQRSEGNGLSQLCNIMKSGLHSDQYILVKTFFDEIFSHVDNYKPSNYFKIRSYNLTTKEVTPFDAVGGLKLNQEQLIKIGHTMYEIGMRGMERISQRLEELKINKNN